MNGSPGTIASAVGWNTASTSDEDLAGAAAVALLLPEVCRRVRLAGGSSCVDASSSPCSSARFLSLRARLGWSSERDS
jgi:hypothetical protein